jgi:endonuclease/exonuclease/phosphatase family metal-dependent hydrolase
MKIITESRRCLRVYSSRALLFSFSSSKEKYFPGAARRYRTTSPASTISRMIFLRRLLLSFIFLELTPRFFHYRISKGVVQTAIPLRRASSIMPAMITVMTYNVHSCVGADGKADPIRVAHVIAAENPDVVALQELDRGLERTGLSDQAKEIAGHLTMHYHFHPSLSWEDGHYGNAILSRLPMELKKAGELPTLPSRKNIEQRGALWVQIAIGRKRLQVINTHLGLNRHERMAQAEMLLSTEWLRNPACSPPVILCGDFNSVPLARVCRWFSAPLRDVFSSARKGRRRTWPAKLPLLRLDYIFTSVDINVREARVVSGGLPSVASDHLPVVAGCSIP